jgi:hypothetical protein
MRPILSPVPSSKTEAFTKAMTHRKGSAASVYTVREMPGKNQPTGMVYTAGQAFRRVDYVNLQTRQ